MRRGSSDPRFTGALGALASPDPEGSLPSGGTDRVARRCVDRPSPRRRRHRGESPLGCPDPLAAGGRGGQPVSDPARPRQPAVWRGAALQGRGPASGPGGADRSASDHVGGPDDRRSRPGGIAFAARGMARSRHRAAVGDSRRDAARGAGAVCSLETLDARARGCPRRVPSRRRGAAGSPRGCPGSRAPAGGPATGHRPVRPAGSRQPGGVL